MDSRVSMQNQISSGDDEEVSEHLLRPEEKSRSIYTDRSLQFLQADLESREIYSANIRDC